MPHDVAARHFVIHGHEAARCAHRIDGLSFVDAALRFVEDCHPPVDADDKVSLTVEDCATGERQCFVIDLATGETAPCD